MEPLSHSELLENLLTGTGRQHRNMSGSVDDEHSKGAIVAVIVEDERATCTRPIDQQRVSTRMKIFAARAGSN